MLNRSSPLWPTLIAVLLMIWGVGMLARGFWTPDEPREADIAWRMSWQTDKAIPLLAGEAFCEKPPLAYWLAAIPIQWLGAKPWVARLPNLLYALVTALSVGLLARRSVGPLAGAVAAGAISTFLLSYQVAIWFATDAPLLAAVSVALLGTYIGFYANTSHERLCGYLLMHAALAVGFLAKSAAAWMVPVLAIITLIIWERRWRELWRWELYAGLGLQAAIILPWVGWVYFGDRGPEHLKIFFWNNLAGRITRVDAPAALQYAAAHQNSPGKYLIELPLYLWPWTLLVIAAVRRTWRSRQDTSMRMHAPRFAIAAFLPTLVVLSLAATARNVYLAPALPGAALLLGWWAENLQREHDRWDIRALSFTAVLLMIAVAAGAAALAILGADAWPELADRFGFLVLATAGLAAAGYLAWRTWYAARQARLPLALMGLMVAYCILLVGPASQAYRIVDRWQDLGLIGRDLKRDAMGRPLILLAPDETTRALVDLYTRTDVTALLGPINSAALDSLRDSLVKSPLTLVFVQIPGREPNRLSRWWLSRAGTPDAQLPWLAATDLRVAQRYSLPNGRRYFLLESRNRP